MLEIRKDRDKYRFVIKSGAGHQLLESVDFADEKELHTCLDQLRKRLRSPSCFERRTVHNGRFQFSLKDSNGRILGRSKLYRSEAGMENGIKNTRFGFFDSDLS